MARYTPTEVKRLVEVLEQDHEDVEALAKAVLVEITDLRATKRRWCAVVTFRGKIYAVLGPFATRKAAEAAAMEAPCPGEGADAWLFPMGPHVEGVGEEAA